jgi:hypothetical protein
MRPPSDWRVVVSFNHRQSLDKTFIARVYPALLSVWTGIDGSCDYKEHDAYIITGRNRHAYSKISG